MPDREKVIEAFDEAKELVWTNDDEYTVGYNNGLEAGKNIALAMLKEQEAVKPVLLRDGRNKYYSDYICHRCGYELTYKQSYCSECGVKIDWEGR